MGAKRANDSGLNGIQPWRAQQGPAAVGNTADLAGAPYRGIIVDADGDYEFIYAGQKNNTSPGPIPLKAGVQYSFIIRRVVAAAGNVYGGGA